MKVIILGGFLGSGKTTFLLELAKHLSEKYKDEKTPLAIIENEIGEVSVDGALLNNYKVKELSSGCVCCTLAGDLTLAVKEIEESYSPHYIVIEATGMAYPDKIAQTVKQYATDDVSTICLADAQRWDELMDYMDVFVKSQLKGAEVILLNKCDLVSSDVSERIANEIKLLNPNAKTEKISAKAGVDFSIFPL